MNPYDIDLDKNEANYTPLTPLSFIERAGTVHPHRTAVIHGTLQLTWSQVYQRSRSLA